MKRLSLLLFLTGSIVAAAPAQDTHATTRDATMGTDQSSGDLQVLAIPASLIVRVDDDTAVPAQEAAVWFAYEHGVVSEVSLRFAVERAVVLDLRGSEFRAEIDNVSLLTMTPDLPVWVLAKGNPELLTVVRSQLEAGGTLDGLATMPGNSGYPLLFDLENYVYQGVVQDSGPQLEGGE